MVFSVGALPNVPPVINAGPVQTVTLPGGVTLSAEVTDDGLPGPPSLLATSWTMVSGPGTVTFQVPDGAVTSATFSARPPVNQPPVVNAGPDQAIVLPAVATLAGTADDDGLPNPPAQITAV